jgi:hypothetical protein
VWTTYPKESNPGRGYPPYNKSKNALDHQLGIDARRDQYPVVAFPQMLGPCNYLQVPEIRDHLLRTERGRRLAQGLFQHGANVLYGLLFHAAFSVAPSVLNQTSETIIPNPNYWKSEESALNATCNCSITLHSRHSSLESMGDDISREIACIEQLWNDQQEYHNGCDLYIMADRPHTIQKLIRWCATKEHRDNSGFPCQRVIYAAHERGMSFTAEHG